MQTIGTSESAGKPMNGKGSAKRTRSSSAAKKTLHLKDKPPAENVSADEISGMIATAAYYCAERRHFEPGHELEDWLTAEREIKSSVPS
jgi:hypothetical protein